MRESVRMQAPALFLFIEWGSVRFGSGFAELRRKGINCLCNRESLNLNPPMTTAKRA